jgi:hypothetical protein
MSDDTDSKSFRRTDALRAVSDATDRGRTVDTDSSRRGFLGRTLGAVAGAVAAAAGASQSGAARTARGPAQQAYMRDLQRSYDAPEVGFAVEQHADHLLADLADRDALDAASADALAVDDLLDAGAYHGRVAAGTDAATVDAVEVDGEVTAHLTVSKPASDGRVTLHVQPEVGRSYAIHRPDEGRPELLDGETTASLCTTECSACSGCCTSVCFGGQVYEEVCCDGTCTIGEPCEDCC